MTFASRMLALVGGPGDNSASQGRLVRTAVAMAALIEVWPRHTWRDCAAEYHDGLKEAGLDRIDALKTSFGLIAAATRIRIRVWYLRPRWPHLVLSSVASAVVTIAAFLTASQSKGDVPAALAFLTIAVFAPPVWGAGSGQVLARFFGGWWSPGGGPMEFFALPLAVVQPMFIWHYGPNPRLGIASVTACLIAELVSARACWVRLVATVRKPRQAGA